MPRDWYAGFVHYHTAFGYKKPHAVSPEELIATVRDLGGSFVFCAGDHGCEYGEGWYEGKDYYEYCLAHSASDVLLVPTGEYHLNFPDLIPDDPDCFFNRYRATTDPEYTPFHHVYLPMLEWNSDVASHTKHNTSERLMVEAHRRDLTVVLAHPWLCQGNGHPDPFAIPWLGYADYLELFNTDEYFVHDWPIYLRYLSMAESARMGTCAGVDFVSHRNKQLDSPGNKAARHITYIYVPGELSLESLMCAWDQRRTYAVTGSLYLEEMVPVPCVEDRRVNSPPQICLSVRSFTGAPISAIEVYRNGRMVHCQAAYNKPAITFSWTDEQYEGGEAHYVIHVVAGSEHLITSPVNIVDDSSGTKDSV